MTIGGPRAQHDHRRAAMLNWAKLGDLSRTAAAGASVHGRYVCCMAVVGRSPATGKALERLV